ncbi:hypothetical protein GH714_019548 [Hevea brasiliensis]|uniref:Glutaredoxin-dependent peroxiredoxin n=1 Tax=Hevea brasiliensis TaxID=3981 RepID=A0A6A6K6U4_HEVBR|nr:hypothetical protein GH714_019548 [Hevea brasiliensis]
MASAILRRTGSSAVKSMVDALRIGGSSRSYAKLSVGTDMVSAAPDVSLQKARTWDKGKKVVIFGLPGAYTGVCSQQHVPSYKNNIDKFKAKGIDSVICVAVNDPYVLNGWAEKLQAKDAIEFYGDFDGSFHKSLELDKDLSVALLGPRSQRWSAYVEDGKVKVLNVEEVPSDFKVSGGEGKVALVTGGDSGIGRAVSYYFTLEGATVAFTYVKGQEDMDTDHTLKILSESKAEGAKDPIAIPTDVGFEENCRSVVSSYG